ncbi:MAG: 2-hydroxy-6-oxohepta-2,4-dienoate hydrolase [uncultured Campylobacterales bacterium]|uniref:2-hydroxy-6-oxohepta-2,4-dienoate hydrolase n=1 Tax=uncultured Campylobacterales bacterium TaxID=352960 RepID=A0A6S6S7Q8_9BACT|nr:MAG: 2-hydroxy-6-oxohepta-2,4-dienoate hydrolase [uncultured Campylobacterales bacterium]
MATKQILLKEKSFDISYIIENPECEKDIIFLHGWGSNKELMQKSFSKYLNDFRCIYIDLPGFGKSTNEYALNTYDYASVIDKFLLTINSDRHIIAGHSFGGKVAVLLNPKNMVLLSSAGIPVKKSFKTRFKIKTFKLLKVFGLGKLYKIFASSDANGLSKNMYQTFKNVVNEDFTLNYKEFKNNALIFWGIRDTATPLSSGKETNELIKTSKFYECDGDHFFFMKNAEFISQKLKELS